MRITTRTLCGIALGMTFAACADPTASGITAPVRPSAYKVAGHHGAPEPPASAGPLIARFVIDDEARFDSARMLIDYSARTSPVGAFVAFYSALFPAPSDASIRFHTDGTLTGTGTLTVPLAVLPLRTPGPVAVIDLARTLDSEQSELDPYCLARNPFYFRPLLICARVRVENVALYDTPSSHPRSVSGTIVIVGDPIVEGR